MIAKIRETRIFIGLKLRPGIGDVLKFMGFWGEDDLLKFLNPN